MNKELNNKEGSNNRGPKAKTKLVVNSFDGEKSVGVELPWRGSVRIVGREASFYDSVVGLSELPAPAELPRILELSRQFGIPSVWKRARPSALESSAATLLTGLAFTRRKQWAPFVRQFFESWGLKVGLRGRPLLDPAQLTINLRGFQIDGLVAHLQEGFVIKHDINRQGGFRSGNEFVTPKLKEASYDRAEIDAILRYKTPQFAAFNLYQAKIKKDENLNLSMHTIRHTYAAYKRLRTIKPPARNRPI